MIAASDWSGLSAWITSALFSPTLALATGIWTGSRKLYEAIFVVWWIIGPVQNAPYLDSLAFKAPTIRTSISY